jgi:hypothetical protein
MKQEEIVKLQKIFRMNKEKVYKRYIREDSKWRLE